MTGGPARWWEGAVLYQVYVRSFADADGDGFGDLAGLRSRLEYLDWLGVDGLWLSPTMPSPDADWGYDVADYLGVHPELGTISDLEALIAEAAEHGMPVLLDLVPNHTSSAHPWFVDARSGRDAAQRDFYVWADPAPGGGPPNNWLCATGTSAWTFDEASGQYYLHNFLEAQPDLNWWNPKVHEAFAEVLRFWFDKGAAGFRIDVAHGLYKDAELRDDPEHTATDDSRAHHGLDQVYSANRPETHGVYRDWRAIADRYAPERLLLGETWVFDLERLAQYCAPDELQLVFNFRFAVAPFEPEALAPLVREWLAVLAGRCPVWTASNHDIGRFPSRWGDDDVRRGRLGLLVLTMLPGAVVLYYGDELAMTDVAVPMALERDQMTWHNPDEPGRDRCRTPMRWSRGDNAGFTRPGVTPWLPIGEGGVPSVAEQREDPRSTLTLTRRLLALRAEHLGGGVAGYEELAVGPDRWVFCVGALTVAANFSPTSLSLALPAGSVQLVSTLGEDRAVLGGTVELAPYEGIVLRG